MKELLTLSGGYPRQMDFILNLQTEMLAMGNAMFASFGFDFVLSGCAVTDNGNGTVNIASGIVYLGDEALRYNGDNNIVSDGSMAMAKSAYVATDSLMFGDGSNKNVYREANAYIVAGDPANTTQLKIKTVLYTINEYIKDTILSSEVKGCIKDVYDLDGTFAANFDDSGLGVTPRWLGWALDNGSFSPGSAGMVLIGQGTYTNTTTGEQTTYVPDDAVGEANHTLTIAEIPSHTHAVTASDNGTSNGSLVQPGWSDNETAHTGTFNTKAAGGDPTNGNLTKPHNIIQPSRVVYRVVKIV